MENINTSTSPLQDPTSDLQKKKNKTALIAGIVILISAILVHSLNFLISCVQNIELYGKWDLFSVNGILKLLFFNSGVIIGELLSFLPTVILFVYLIAFYKKNPAHATLKVHYIFRIARNLLGMFACVMSILINLSNSPEDIGADVLYFFDWTTAMVIAIISCVIVFTKFRYYKAARIVEIINFASAFVFNLANLIFHPENLTNILWYLSFVFWAAFVAFKVVFWFKCIDADTPARIPVKKKSTPQSVYQPPVQPVVPPIYQPPVQPVYQVPVQPTYQPVYQTPPQPVVQNTAPAVNPQGEDAEEKLTKLKRMLESGLITQEDFEKKKDEILENF